MDLFLLPHKGTAFFAITSICEQSKNKNLIKKVAETFIDSCEGGRFGVYTKENIGTDYTEQVEIIDYLSEKKFYNWAYDFGFALTALHSLERLEPMFECIVPTILAGKLTDLVDSTNEGLANV